MKQHSLTPQKRSCNWELAIFCLSRHSKKKNWGLNAANIFVKLLVENFTCRFSAWQGWWFVVVIVVVLVVVVVAY